MSNEIQELSREYEREISRIENARLLSWSSAAGTLNYGGFELLPLTVRAWIDLRLIGNAFVKGEFPDRKDFFSYIWRSSPGYRKKGAFWSKLIIERNVKKKNIFELNRLINDHIRDAFEEMPQTASNGSYYRTNGIPAVDPIAGAMDEVGSRYGINPMEVLDWPLNRLYQMQKAARSATIEKYNPLAPATIRVLNSRILERMNN